MAQERNAQKTLQKYGTKIKGPVPYKQLTLMLFHADIVHDMYIFNEHWVYIPVLETRTVANIMWNPWYLNYEYCDNWFM